MVPRESFAWAPARREVTVSPLGKYVQMLRLLDINHKDFEAFKLFGEFLCLPIFALQERENPKANYYTRTGNKCIVIRTVDNKM